MNSKYKPELLCPVGGKQQLIAAVENGADAIYMGGASYNARIYANNFDSIDSIEEAVDYAHLRNVKVYITLNTLLNDDEINDAIIYARKLYEIGVDAVIVQDLGLIDAITKLIPNLKIHISTQATVYSKEAIGVFKNSKSVDRIVLARELSINEINEIIKSVNKEIEIFVHGALCVCYSGQCKLSSQIGARSGNRGKCAQPCRLPYKLNGIPDNHEEYYLSTKDICTIDILPEIIKTGVHSLKIEGRMKSPEYVAAVTKIYRKYIDKCFEGDEYSVYKEDKETLLQVFNRGNFTEGYLKQKSSKEIWCKTRPKNAGLYIGKVIEYDKRKNNIVLKLDKDVAIGDVIEVANDTLPSAVVSFIRVGKDRVKEAIKSQIAIIGDIKGNIKEGQEVYKIVSKKLNNELKNYFSSKSLKKNSISCKVILKIDKKPRVVLKSNIFEKEYEIDIEYGQLCERAINRSTTIEDVKYSLSKTGDVPFVMDNIEAYLEEAVFTTSSNLNNVRRKALEVLSQKIIKGFKKVDKKTDMNICVNDCVSIKNCNRKTKISGYIYSLNLLDNLDELSKLDRVYISLNDMILYKERILSNIPKQKICIYLPTITTEKYKKYIEKNMSNIIEINNILITNLEHLTMFDNLPINIYIDNSFNIFNTYSINSDNFKNVKGVNLSSELTLNQIKEIKAPNNKEIEVDIYGNQQLMYSKFCILNANGNCGECNKKRYVLSDRKNKNFPVLFNNIQCTTQILNADKLFCKDAIKSLANKVDYMRVYLYDEDKGTRKQIIDSIKELLEGKEIRDTFISNDQTHFTNGHFYKEV